MLVGGHLRNVGQKGGKKMAFETKALLVAIAKIIVKSDDLEEVYSAVADIANTEGVILEKYPDEKKKDK
jgi:hypothetical protein